MYRRIVIVHTKENSKNNTWQQVGSVRCVEETDVKMVDHEIFVVMNEFEPETSYTETPEP